jgi:phospholipid/cholesterol/gamma-HCH transport system substrate-binding protein
MEFAPDFRDKPLELLFVTNKTSMFKLGLFVLLGFLILAAALIWIGRRDTFNNGYHYVTYFAESVQGLQVGSPIKYQGIEVGRVQSIQVAPDPMLIEVAFTINADPALGQLVMAGIAITGITGQAYIELLPQESEEVAKSPRVDFPTPHTLIPSYSRGVSKMLISMNTTMENLSHVDFAGLSKQAGQMLQTIQDLLNSQEIRDSLTSFHYAAQNLNSFSSSLSRMARQAEGGNAIANLTQAADNIKTMADELRQRLEQLKLEEFSVSAGNYMDEIGRALGSLSNNLVNISDSLNYMLASLQSLSARLANTPSDLIFSQPPPPLPQETVTP